MKNRLIDVADHLMEQLERLNDPDLKGEDLEREIDRAKSMSEVAKTVVGVRAQRVEAARVAFDMGIKVPPQALLEGPAADTANGNGK